MTSRYEELLMPEQRDRVVEQVVRALKTQGKLPTKTLNDFRDLFKAGKPIPGFNNDPLRAMSPLLKQQLLERLDINPDLEGLIVSTWADTEPQLSEAVSERLDSFDPQSHEDDEIDEELWDAQISMLAAENSDYEEDDILLMTKICFAHAKIQADSDREDGEVGADTKPAPRDPFPMEETLDAVLESLRDMPAGFPQWSDAVPRFVASLNELIDEKKNELIQVRGLMTDLDHIQDAFETELAFFRHGGEEWDTPIVAMLLAVDSGIDESTRRLAELKDALALYRQIKERADNLAEERERREKRHDLEETIEGMLHEIDVLAQNADTPDDDPSTDASILSETGAPSDSADTQPQPQSEAYSVLQDELNALRGEYESLLSSNHALKQDSASIEDKVRALEGEIAGLNVDKQTLTEEVAGLRDQLRISETNEVNWRIAYEAEVRSKDASAPEPIPAEVESLRRAVDLARARYGDRLVFRLNKKSDQDYNYSRPKEVWDALEWLATTYHDSQTGEAQTIDLNESIRNTCGGWEYKSNQTDITFNMYREWYTTTKDGKTYELRKHLSKGTGRDANVIRIAFAWDEDSERVIVGFVGPHQRSRSS